MMRKMRKTLIVLLAALVVIMYLPPSLAITVDGVKSPGEWDEGWAFGQDRNSSHPAPVFPYGDRLEVEQDATGVFNMEDPKNDSGAGFDESMAQAGESSGFDIKRFYAHYDASNDIMYGMCVVYGKPGDLDGDGNIGTLCPPSPIGFGDCLGNVGPGGVTGIGESEYFSLTYIQGPTTRTIKLIDNDWLVNGFAYNDINFKWTNAVDGVIELSIENFSVNYFDVLCADPINGYINAGGSGDVVGEDAAGLSFDIPCPDIEIVKYVQGNDDVWYDANTPATGPVMANGSDVDWRYVVTNTGDEPLKDVVVTDDQGVTVTCLQDTLDVGETMTCTADGTVPDPCDPYANMGYVEGVGKVSGITVTDEDPAHYRCPDVPALTPAGLMALIGILGMIGIVGLKRRT
jgi:hypothetical protein